MGSRPTRVRSVDLPPEGVNGSVSKVNELQTENTRLKKRLADLDKFNPEALIRENDRLKKQNEELRTELGKVKQKKNDSAPVKKSSDLSARNGLHHDVSSDINLTPSPNTDRRNILSDRSSSPGCSSCKTSPNVNDGRKRKIDPNSVLQRMSDIDAYGQGLPLADSSLKVRHVRRTRYRKRASTQLASNAKDDSPTNSDGTASPAEVLPNEVRITHNEFKSGEDGPTDSGINSTDLEQLHGDQGHNQEPNDILMT